MEAYHSGFPNEVDVKWSNKKRWNQISFMIQMYCLFKKEKPTEPLYNSISKELLEWFIKVEEEIFRQHFPCYEPYFRKCSQISYNLKQNGIYLTEQYQPLEIVAANDNDLSKGTLLEQKRLDFENQMTLCKSMLSNTDIYKSTASKDAMMTCSKCKSTNIQWQMVQTRGADEGMTVFCTCINCNKKWTISR